MKKLHKCKRPQGPHKRLKELVALAAGINQESEKSVRAKFTVSKKLAIKNVLGGMEKEIEKLEKEQKELDNAYARKG